MNACSKLDPAVGKLEDIKEIGNEVFTFKKEMLQTIERMHGRKTTNCNLGKGRNRDYHIGCFHSTLNNEPFNH